MAQPDRAAPAARRARETSMGLLGGLLGHAGEVDVAEVERDLATILVDGERIERAFRLVRDLILFTDRRLLLVDRQGMSGKKVEYRSIPYHHISQFAAETSGRFDMDAELRIWIVGEADPITKEFRKDKNIFDVQKALATYVLR
jgi:hypothetical protein